MDRLNSLSWPHFFANPQLKSCWNDWCCSLYVVLPDYLPMPVLPEWLCEFTFSKRKQLELSSLTLVQMYSMVAVSHAKKTRSRGNVTCLWKRSWLLVECATSVGEGLQVYYFLFNFCYGVCVFVGVTWVGVFWVVEERVRRLPKSVRIIFTDYTTALSLATVECVHAAGPVGR